MDDRHPSVASECTETVHGRILDYSGWLFRQTQWALLCQLCLLISLFNFLLSGGLLMRGAEIC